MKGFFLFIAAVFISLPAFADEAPTIVIKDHKFTPANLNVAAGQKIRLTVDNQDATAEEFESDDLHSEKVIQGNSKAVILIGPLKSGTYKYFGEFNEDTAQGTITAK